MSEKLITVATYPFSRAQVVKGRLENEGVECVITNVNPIRGSVSSTCKVKVNEKDLDKALPIIIVINDEFSKSKRRIDLAKQSESLITFTTTTFSRSQLIKGFFESEGIECFLSNASPISGSLPGSVNLSIKQRDLKKALDILIQLEDEETPQKPRKFEFNNIVVGVDFTEYSLNSAKYAMHLANLLKIDVELVNCYYTPLIETTTLTDAYFESYVNIEKMQSEIKQSSEKQMEDVVTSLNKYAKDNKFEKIKISAKCINGDPADELLHYVDENNTSLLIMGSSSHSRTTNRFFGSVTAHIAENAPIPVLIIPPNAKFDKEKMKKDVMYVSRLDESDFISIAKLMGVIQPLNVELHTIHLSIQGQELIDEARLEGLKAYFKSVYPKYKIKYHIVTSDKPEDAFNDYVLQNDIDISSYTYHKQSVIGHFFNPDKQNSLMYNVNIPLLIFHG